MARPPAPAPGERSPDPRARVAVLVVVLLVGGGLWWLLRDTGPAPTGARTYTGNGVSFEYPATWAMNDTGWPSGGFGSVWGILGTMPWGPCLPGDINCHYQVRLEPGQIEVGFARGAMVGGRRV